jgi:four helix bundle protein
MQYSFEKLEVHHTSRKLTKEIYKISDQFPKEERFGLTNQMRRAAVSVSLNLAEGTSRFSVKEKIRFLEISYGSLMEVLACLHITEDLGFIIQKMYHPILKIIHEVSNKINALKRHFQKST